MFNKESQSKGGKTMAIRQRVESLEKYYANPNICLQCKEIINVPDGIRCYEIKKRKFCSASCAATFNNTKFPKRQKTQKTVELKLQVKTKEQQLIEYYKNPKKCLHCDKILTVPEHRKVSAIKQKKFCNPACAAIYNSAKHFEKLKSENDNGIKIETLTHRKTLIGRTKIELFNSSINWQAARSIIQRHARTTYKISNKPKCCMKCGYNNHYEVCHKISVSSFNDDANIVNEINHIDNLIALCPNHHWEFDKGILNMEL